MPFVPNTFVLFQYDPMTKVLSFVSCSYILEHLTDIVNKCNDCMYYSIYKYYDDVSRFNGQIKGNRYRLHNMYIGSKNTCVYHYSPMEYAIRMESDYDWYFQSMVGDEYEESDYT